MDERGKAAEALAEAARDIWNADSTRDALDGITDLGKALEAYDKSTDCEHKRRFWIGGQCNDMCGWSSTLNDANQQDGYVPNGLGLGGGDNVEVEVCLDCKQAIGLDVDAIVALTEGVRQ